LIQSFTSRAGQPMRRGERCMALGKGMGQVQFSERGGLGNRWL
jgi:hypothetical protein